MVKEKSIVDSMIHIKREKEANNLSALKDSLQRSSQVAQGMTTILTSFENRLAKLEQTILPVYTETETLQRRQNNIEKTLAALDYVISYYNVANEVDHVIKDGPTSGLEVYLESINKIRTSIQYFEDNNSNSPELHNLTTLFDTAGDALEKEFRSLLTRYSKPVPAIVILNLVAVDEELGSPNGKTPIEHLPVKTIMELTRISEWLLQNRRDDFMNVYSSIRANILLRSLQGLKDHQKSASGSSISSLSLPIHSSPALSRARLKDSTAAKGTKKIQQAIINKASKKFANISQSVEQAAGFALGHRKQSSTIDVKDEVVDVDMEYYQMLISALHKLMQSEMKLMEGIIPAVHVNKAFERIVHPGFDFVVQEGENVASKAKKSVSKHDFIGALGVFPIIKHLISLKPEIDQLLQNCQPTICNKFACVIDTLHSMGLKALEDFIESIKSDLDRQMPKDGTVHELTSNVMMFLEQLMDYTETVGSLLLSITNILEHFFKEIGDRAIVFGFFPVADKRLTSPTVDKKKTAVGHYILRVLTTLNLTLCNKSDSYNDAFLKSIFRLNNLHYILKSLQRSGLLEIVQMYNRDVEDHFSDQIREHKRLYSHSWSRVLHYVMEVDKPLSSSSTTGKLKDKDRQNIKDKFTGFNKEMDDIFKMQKGYAIPDVELRESIKRENKEFILPKYQAFYDKYIEIQFSKNPDKYVKYTPIQISNLLDKFFDVAA